MKPVFCASLFITMLLLAAIPAAAQAPAGLESLDPSTALLELRASEGVVFVDLYAEW